MSEPELLPVPWASAPTTETEGVVQEVAQGRVPADGREVEDAIASGAKPEYQCRFCLKKFEKATSLGGHMNVHRQERKREELEAARRMISETHHRRLVTSALAATIFDCNPGMPLPPSLGPNCNYFVQSNDLRCNIQGEYTRNIMQNQHLLPPSPVPNCNYYSPSNPSSTSVPAHDAFNVVQYQQQQNQQLLPPSPVPNCNYYSPSNPSSTSVPAHDAFNVVQYQQQQNQQLLPPSPGPTYNYYLPSIPSSLNIPGDYDTANMLNQERLLPLPVPNNFEMYGLSQASGSNIPANYVITHMQNQQPQWPRGIDDGFSNAASNSLSASQGGDSFYHLVDNSMTTSLQSMDVEAEEFANSVLRSSSPPDVDGSLLGSSATPSPLPETFD